MLLDAPEVRRQAQGLCLNEGSDCGKGLDMRGRFSSTEPDSLAPDSLAPAPARSSWLRKQITLHSGEHRREPVGASLLPQTFPPSLGSPTPRGGEAVVELRERGLVAVKGSLEPVRMFLVEVSMMRTVQQKAIQE